MSSIHPNFFATLVLGTFPLVMLGLFLMYRPTVAVLASFLISELLLPPIWALPISPSWLTKWTLPPFVALLLVLVFGRGQLRGSRPFRGIESVFLILLVSSFMTYWTNRDPLHYGHLKLPAEGVKDLFGDIARDFADTWIVFFLGRSLFKTSRDLRTLARMFVVAGLLYSLLILFEIRMSPQLNIWIYGFNAGRFDMVYRWGGYRPTVFFKDGLPLASFLVACVIMAFAMGRAGMRLRAVSMRTVSLYLLFILIICKSTGAILYGLVAIPLVYFSPPKRTLLVASLFAVVFLAYPVLRLNDAIPVKSIGETFGGVSTERAGSLLYRFDMEEGMLESTKERLWWGWGGWGRNFQYTDRGEQLSVPDGALIIELSSHGIVGALAFYLPFAYTILRAWRLIRKIRSKHDRYLLAALALNCGIILFDLILNSAFFPAFVLLFGALYGLPAGILAEERAAEAAEAAYAADDEAWLAADAQPT